MYDSSYADMATFASAATFASLISTYSLIILAFYVLIIVAQWKIFTKAGQEGWKAIIPIYNVVVLYKIIGLSPWFMVPYSDTYSIIFPITVLYNYTVKEKKWYNYLMIGLFSYAGYLIKPTAIIVLIAIAIVEIYKSLFKIKDDAKTKLKEYARNILCLI